MNTNRITNGLFLTTLCVLQQHALAQESVDEIIVTASRTERPLNTIPNTVTLINQKALLGQININNDMSTILGNLIPSFSPSRQKLTSAGETLRGRSPMYMIDGVPQSNPLRDGSRDGHTIDPLMLERVEVIHGANAIHGLGASGGIINLITRDSSPETVQNLRIESDMQSEDVGESIGYGASYNFAGQLGDVDVLASLVYRETGIAYDADGDVIGFDNTQGDTMDSTTLNGFLKLGYDWDDQRVEFALNHYDIAGNNDWVTVAGDVGQDLPTTASKGNILGDAPANEVTLLSLNYTKENFLGHSLHIHAFTQEFTATYGGGIFATFQDPLFGTNIFDQSANNSEKEGVKITLVKDQLASLPLSVVYGLDIFSDTTYQELVQTSRKWVPATEYSNYAPFVQFEAQPIDDMTVTLGVRHEESTLEVDDFTTLASYNGGQFVVGGEPDFSETLLNLGATYNFADYWRVFGNYSESFSMPDVGRVLRGINQPNLTVESFLDLKPILTENAEIGLEFDTQNFNAQLSYYTSESDFGQRLQANADGIFSVEREQTEIDGLEFRAEWLPTANDSIAVRYARTEGEYDSNADGRVDTDLAGQNIAPNRINLSWDRAWTDRISSRLQLNRLLNRKFDNSVGVQTAEFDGYTTVDASANLEMGSGILSLNAQNLTNKDYFTYYSQTTPNNNRYFKGIGRSISLSYSMQF
ncbi:MAG: TonB-dependent receptor [Pseudohongiella sp.]|nr:MAG: TonB-dependent receptor [Pseudohongiella sp.]